MKATYYRMKIKPEDYELFKKVLKVVYNDLGEMLKAYNSIDLKITDKEVHFNDFKLDFKLEDNQVIKLLLNLHFVISKNSHLFSDQDRARLNEQDWYVDYLKLKEAIIKSQNRKGIRSAFWG